MGVNTNKECVVQKWMFELSWKEQTVSLSALRGCDSVGKHDISKKIVRRLRGTILHNAGADCNTEFMRTNITAEEVFDFSKNIDAYPVHFLLHLIHASEIIGYCCPNWRDGDFFSDLYITLVRAFHMEPESKESMHERLSDGVDTICHKT